MRVLLDEHLPRKLARELTGHQPRGVREMGWGALQNGALLRQAAGEGFRAMLTMDKRIPDQQNLANRIGDRDHSGPDDPVGPPPTAPAGDLGCPG